MKRWILAQRGTWWGRWLPLLLAMGVIFFASHQPAVDLPDFGLWDLTFKKLGHFLAYGVLALLAFRAVLDWQRPYLTTFLIVFLYALSDEFHQTFVPGRNGTLVDVVIDMCGALSCLWLLHRHGWAATA
ncbi:VanZ family protein [Candidatus Leptofilum sp.]|uniref:VanZ family protein n=1 Tax=Candidatus Leptofilum sp. TaxID=3241576 RepID=UPI003B5A050B